MHIGKVGWFRSFFYWHLKIFQKPLRLLKLGKKQTALYTLLARHLFQTHRLLFGGCERRCQMSIIHARPVVQSSLFMRAFSL